MRTRTMIFRGVLYKRESISFHDFYQLPMRALNIMSTILIKTMAKEQEEKFEILSVGSWWASMEESNPKLPPPETSLGFSFPYYCYHTHHGHMSTYLNF
ncbi:hypothetical protein AVEN_205795-1 [Araneus ventricosus]|uniref:Uncharacterized protein n=1 Tax=Araneus ventricosus TaxID=182803 RepID=A0A4Y2WVJ8_ARAVE|nr:hypothetical protein AVEN_205795-1 [Araneus ventricosus]